MMCCDSGSFIVIAYLSTDPLSFWSYDRKRFFIEK